MPDKNPWRQAQAEKKDIFDTYHPVFLALIRASIDYGQLAVRSSFILNGGALLAMPAYLARAGAVVAENNVYGIILAAACYIAGIIFAALCSYAAFFNFERNAYQVEWEILKKISEIEENYDGVAFHRMKDVREDYRNKLEAGIKRFGWWAHATTWISHIFGVFSYIAFVFGCFFAGKVMLGNSALNPPVWW